MDIRATKDNFELEEEEAERLVREAPKIKPPRDDKKREDVHERDPDTDGDPDLKSEDGSLNYKNVGGSARVVARFLGILAADKADKDDEGKSNTWVKVRNREKGRGTRVRPETLRDEPGKYEKVPPNETEEHGGKPRMPRKPQKPHYHKDEIPHPPWPDPRPMPKSEPRPARPPRPLQPLKPKVYPEPEHQPKEKPPGWVPERRKPASVVVARFLQAREFANQDALKQYLKDHPEADPKDHTVKEQKDEVAPEEAPKPEGPKAPEPPSSLATSGQALRDLGKANPAIEAKLKDFSRPESDLSGLAKGNPKLPASAFFPGVKLPEGLKTLGDVAQALEQSKPVKGQKPPKAKSKEHQILDGVVPEPEKPAETPKAEAKPEPAKDEKPAEPKPEEKKPESDGDSEKPDGKTEKPEKKAPTEPKPKRRQPSKEEVAAMHKEIAMSLPLDIAEKLWDMHPDDYHRIKAGIHTNAQIPIPPGQLDEHIEKAKQFYTLDPASVKPPKQAKDAEGRMVPYEALPPDQQAEAWAQHRNDVVGASIGLHKQVAQTFEKMGMPTDLAGILTRHKLGSSRAGNVFNDVLEAGNEDKMSPKARIKAISRLTDPKAQQLATEYFQGQDYLDARNQFLDPMKNKGVSEFSKVTDINQALQMGSAMINERAKAYPEEFRDPQVGSRFRARILRKLEALDPAKAVVVQKAVDDMDADDYDASRKLWEKAQKETLREREKRDKQRQKIVEKFEKEQAKATAKAQDGDYREKVDKVVPLEERMKGLEPENDPELPKEPQKPARYDLVRGIRPKAKEQHNGILERMETPKPPPVEGTKKSSFDDRDGPACRVVGRYLAFLLVGRVMRVRTRSRQCLLGGRSLPERAGELQGPLSWMAASTGTRLEPQG